VTTDRLGNYSGELKQGVDGAISVAIRQPVAQCRGRSGRVEPPAARRAVQGDVVQLAPVGEREVELSDR
jgi:hypothetical protein